MNTHGRLNTHGSVNTQSSLNTQGSANDRIRRQNLSAVLGHIHRHGPSTRFELAAETGLSRATVGLLAAELDKMGLIHETPVRAAAGPGRPVSHISAADSVAALAVEIEATCVRATLMGLGQRSGPSAVHMLDATPTPELASTIVAGLLAELSAPLPERTRLAGIGIAVPGQVGSGRGVVGHAANLGWRNVPLGDLVTAATGLPTWVGNDATLGIKAATTFGGGLGGDDVVYLYGGPSGIGGGVVTGGHLLNGASGYATELGHIPVEPDGQLCACGARGCLETEVQAGWLLQLAGLEAHDVEALADALADPARTELHAEVLRQMEWVVMALRTLANIFNPSLVLLGGFIGAMYASLSTEEIEALTHGAFTVSPVELRIQSAPMGPDLMLAGAAEMVFRDLLAAPDLYPAQQSTRSAQQSTPRRSTNVGGGV